MDITTTTPTLLSSIDFLTTSFPLSSAATHQIHLRDYLSYTLTTSGLLPTVLFTPTPTTQTTRNKRVQSCNTIQYCNHVITHRHVLDTGCGVILTLMLGLGCFSLLCIVLAVHALQRIQTCTFHYRGSTAISQQSLYASLQMMLPLSSLRRHHLIYYQCVVFPAIVSNRLFVNRVAFAIIHTGYLDTLVKVFSDLSYDLDIDAIPFDGWNISHDVLYTRHRLCVLVPIDC